MSNKNTRNVFECRLQIRWSDQDLNGHVNNARLVTLVEEARVRAGRHWFGTTPDGQGTNPRVVRSLRVEFNAPVTYFASAGSDGYLDARVWVSRIGRTSYTVSHELAHQAEVYVYCETVIVTLDRETRRPAPFSVSSRNELLRFLHAAK